jgi:4-amino-4-deoxy-L-arabinose transferase-like glycosyltransferase
VACGVGTLARAELALLVPFVVLPLALLSGDATFRQKLGRGVLAGAVSVAVVLPWSAWNTARFEEPVLLSSNDGLTLIGANCDSMFYGQDIGVWDLVCAFAVPVDEAGDQSERSAEYRDAALEYLGNQKSRVPVVAVARVGRVWSLYAPGQMVDYSAGAVDTCRADQEAPCPGEGREAWAAWAGTVMFWLLLAPAVLGVVALRRAGAGLALLPLLMTFVVVTITAVLFYGLVRFRVPAEVALVVLAAAGLDDGWSRLRPGSQAPAPAATAEAAP